MTEHTRLTDDDWSDLIPCKDFKLGKTVLVIEPLGIASLAKFTVQIKAIFKQVGARGISAEDIDSPEGMSTLFEVAVIQAPELLEMASGLHRKDIARLPIGTALGLLKEVIEINIQSQDSLVENLKSLGELLGLWSREEAVTEKAGE